MSRSNLRTLKRLRKQAQKFTREMQDLTRWIERDHARFRRRMARLGFPVS